MKKIIFIFALMPMFLVAQNNGNGRNGSSFFDWGLRAGVHNTQTSVNGAEGKVRSGDPQAGYHLGTFTRFNFGLFYVEPEFQFASSRGELEFLRDGESNTYRSIKFNRFDLPIQIGQKLGPLRVYGGINFNFNRTEGLSSVISSGLREETRAWRAGIGLDAGNFSMDVRYESSLGNNVEGIRLDGEPFAGNLRFTHIYLSLGFTII
ncbi:MAG: PorT family protein [Cryomorphaceae bacterium]|nr:PorT family protein [Cryomorphaceae bacterium]